jgi:hypothetical protein
MTTNIEDAIWQCLENAVKRFNKSSDPQSLLCPRCENPKNPTEKAAASERSIAYRLAFYLESEMRNMGLVSDLGPVVIDCEYNRHVAEVKSLAEEAEKRIKKIVKAARRKELKADGDGYYVFSVAPDVLVHQRRTDDNNLLVVDIKKRSNPETDEYDGLKLELFTKSKKTNKGYGYKFGAWVVAEDELCDPMKRELKIIMRYEDGIGTKLLEGS